MEEQALTREQMSRQAIADLEEFLVAKRYELGGLVRVVGWKFEDAVFIVQLTRQSTELVFQFDRADLEDLPNDPNVQLVVQARIESAFAQAES